MEGIQTEAQLERAFVNRLVEQGWDEVKIPDAAAMEANLRRQLEKHNRTAYSNGEFKMILNHLSKGNVFDKAKTLRDRMTLHRDDGSVDYVQFFNDKEWCRNEYQVTTQVTQTGTYTTRYDVSLLINGLPLVHTELKRRGVELREAFNQINRYQKHSFWTGHALFQYVQIFVISNGVNTKYYANNRRQDFKQTFFWADEDNTSITSLEGFTDAFLEKCFVSKMIAKYVVQHESTKSLMVLRPYQYYAVERILDRVAKGRKNGYIWHTTGSGKTLTSFKAAQAIIENPKVAKAVFVVDRADLDYQTTVEFNEFCPGSVDGTDNTAALVRQLNDPDAKLVVTTLQKLNNALSRQHHRDAIEQFMNERVVFVFDECHRSQFGEAHKRITDSFPRAQLFGFTGTPILAKNSIGKRTTTDLFQDCLHRYVITDAIRDENVLRFGVEYWGKLKRKDGTLLTDEEVAGIDQKSFFESEERIDGVVDWIIDNHDRKTHGRQFGAIMCAGSVEALTRTYQAFQRKKEAGLHDLRVATVFTFAANEADEDANGLIGEPDVTGGPVTSQNQHSRDKLAGCVADYNKMFGENASISDQRGFYSYYKSLAKRMKSRDRQDFVPEQGIDILLVVNMFLTGFDAKTVNTLYVDKNLRYHGLIQALSRTNRILGQKKSQGNIVCFRNLKEKVDEAVTLFSNKDALEEVLMAPYETYVERFAEALDILDQIAPTPEDVDRLASEDDDLAFVHAFRELIRLHNVLSTFSEFSFDDLGIDKQTFGDFKSKYLDIHDKVKGAQTGDEPASIIGEVDFELELIRRDNINVAYILTLLASIADRQDDPLAAKDIEAQKKAIFDALGAEDRLRSKRDLIEEFINSHLPSHRNSDEAKEGFEGFWGEKRKAAFLAICEEEDMCADKLGLLVERYLFSGKEPLSAEITDASTVPLGIMKRRKVSERVVDRIRGYVETFDDHLGNLEAV